MRRTTTIGQQINSLVNSRVNSRINFARISSLCTSNNGFNQSYNDKPKIFTKRQTEVNNEKSKKKDTYEDYSDTDKPNQSYVPFTFGLSDYFHFSNNGKSSKNMDKDTTESDSHWDSNDSGSDD